MKRLMTLAVVLALCLPSCSFLGSGESVSARVSMSTLDLVVMHFGQFNGVSSHDRAGFAQAVEVFAPHMRPDKDYGDIRIPATLELVQAATQIKSIHDLNLMTQDLEPETMSRYKMLSSNLAEMFKVAHNPLVTED